MAYRIKLVVFFLTLFGANLRADEWVKITSDQPAPATVELSTNNNTLEFVITIPGFVKQKNQDGSCVIRLNNSTPLFQKGNPDLLKLSHNIYTSPGSIVSISEKGSRYFDFQNIDIAPSYGYFAKDDENSSYIYNNVYTVDDFFPVQLFNVDKPYRVRNVEGHTIQIFPFRYNPVQKTLRVYYELKLEAVINNNEEGLNLDYISDPVFKQLFADKLPASTRNITVDVAKPRMLIISHGMFLEVMDEFVDWKNQKGISTELVDVANIGDAIQIRNFVSNYYHEHGLTYLLLVGDAELVPTYITTNGPSDNHYSYIEGDDHYCDIIVGRFSGEKIRDIKTQVDRTLYYERDIELNASWLNNCVGVASEYGPGDNNEYDYEHMRIIQKELSTYQYKNIFELYDGDQGEEDENGDPDQKDLSNVINNGAGLLLYTGIGTTTTWSTTHFSNYDVKKLINYNKLPFIISAGCYSGDFEGKTCFAESWMRSSHNDQPTGAIASLMASGKLSWFPPMYAQDNIVDYLVNPVNENKCKSIGMLVLQGLNAMNDKYGYGGFKVTDIWTLFGDPSIDIRTSAPEEIIANVPDFIAADANTLTIECELKCATVSISAGNKPIGYSIMDSGYASIEITEEITTDKLLVVITAHNHRPLIKEITVLSHPTEAQKPSPVNYSQMVPPQISLAWENGDGTQPEYYKLYVGTDYPPTNIINGIEVASNHYNPDIHLDYNKTFYWRVDAINKDGSATGNIWQFTTNKPPDEDFESTNFPRESWSLNGDASWNLDSEEPFSGRYSAKSGDIDVNETSTLSYSTHVEGNDYISFWLKVSSIPVHNKLTFMIDGIPVNEWSGNIEWTNIIIPVSPGFKTFEWVYSKASEAASELDCAWIDDIHLPSNNQINVHILSGNLVCPEQPIMLSAFASNCNHIEWISEGDGNFSDKHDPNSIYIPGMQDIEKENVQVRLRAYNFYSNQQVSIPTHIKIAKKPDISFNDEVLFADEEITLNAYDNNIVSYLWSPTGESSPEISLNAGKIGIGTHEVSLSYTSSDGCNFKETFYMTFQEKSDKEKEGFPQHIIYPNPSNGQLFINLSVEGRDIITNRFYNQYGHLVFESEPSEIKDNYFELLDISIFPRGIYYLTTEGNNNVSTKKVIIN